MSPSRDQQQAQNTEGDDAGFVTLGRVSSFYGVRGWVKIHSDTDPRDNILSYSPWYLNRGKGWEVCEPEGGRAHGKSVVVKLLSLLPIVLVVVVVVVLGILAACWARGAGEPETSCPGRAPSRILERSVMTRPIVT